MKGILGYGRYDDEVVCPRAKSDMTPCTARDGWTAATNDGHCVDCGSHAADLLKELVNAATEPDALLTNAQVKAEN